MATDHPTAVHEQAKLKRSITLPQALGITFHQIVGAGILAILGSAVALTGGGVPWALLIAAIAVALSSIPYAAMASALPTAGGMYFYAARVLHPTAGYMNLSFVVLGQITAGITALSAGIYMQSLFPAFDPHVVAVVLILGFAIVNLLGASFSARVGIALAIIMLAAYAVFIIVGLMNVNWATYPTTLPNGVGGLLKAAALSTFVLGGGTFVAELGSEMKKPGRTIPISIIGGTLFAGVLYILLSLPAAGVLPLGEVAGKPLSIVAQHMLPGPLFVFFVVGGGLVAALGTMNSSMTWGTKALLIAIGDDWFPARFGSVNKRFGTPHYLIVTVTIIALLPVLLGYGIEQIVAGVGALLSIAFIVLTIASLRLRAKRPELFQRAAFRMPKWLHVLVSVVAILCYVITVLLLVTELNTQAIIGIAVWLIASVIWFAIRYHRVRGPMRERARLLLNLDEMPASDSSHRHGDAATFNHAALSTDD